MTLKMTPQSGLALEIAEFVKNSRELTDVDTVLSKMTDTAAKSVPGAQYAAVTVASRDGKVRTASATSHYPAVLDDIQQRYSTGPCLSAAWKHDVIHIAEMATAQRWPLYCRHALEETPVRSILSFQLFADHRTVGALTLYAEDPNAFDDDAFETGLIVATRSALAWNMVCRDEQFRSALASRDIIGQAKGMLMERFKIDAVQAFELLKRLSQTSNTRLATVASELVKSAQHDS